MSSSCCGVSERWAVFRRRGSKEGAESGGRTRSPLRSGAQGGSGFLWQLRPPDPCRFLGINAPASWPVSCIAGAVLVRTTGLAAHGSGSAGACTGKRPVSWGEARLAYNSGGDEASFTSGVPHHTPPDLAVSVPLLSHTPTPVGSLVKGGVKGRGADDNKGGGSRLVTLNKIYIYIYISVAAADLLKRGSSFSA